MFPTVKLPGSVRFPRDFRFGLADGDLQVISEANTLAEEGSEPTMWLRFAEKQGIATPEAGIDRYHRWQEDAGHLARLGVKHYRTSISMSRLLRRDGQPNGRAVEWYRRYFSLLKESGTSIYGTLYHWELPQYMQERGGWLNRDAAGLLALHARTVAEQLGDLIDEYLILNEPWCSSFLSYYEGPHAPGHQFDSGRENLRAAILASHHLMVGQAMAFEAIREVAPEAKISTVFNYQPAYTVDTDPANTEAARIRDGYYNAWFLDATFRGAYPEWMVEFYGDLMPQGYEADMPAIRIGDRLHALGVNYYRGGLYYAAGGELRSDEGVAEDGPLNDLGWPIFRPPHYAEGLYDILQQVWFGYRAFGLKRVYVSENGMALRSEWDGQAKVIEDLPRIEYLREHVAQVYKAMVHGIPIEGYFAWTLIDNYEWAEGYEPNSAFGLIYVDRDTMRRVPKRSAHWFSALAASHDVSAADAVLPAG